MKKEKNYLKASLLFLLCILLTNQHLQSQAIKINNLGNVGINGNASTSLPFTVNGNSVIIGDLTLTGYLTACNNIGNSEFGEIRFTNECVQIYGGSESNGVGLKIHGKGYMSGALLIASDKRVKKNIKSIDASNLMTKINNIEGKTYQYKSYDELVKMHENNEVHYSVDTINVNNAIYSMAIYDKSKLRTKSEIKSKYSKKVIHKYGINRMINDSIGIRINAPRLNSKTEYGVLAQDIAVEFPELVELDSISGLYSVNYNGFVPILIEALKLTSKRLEEVEQKLAILEGKSKKKD